MQSSILGMGYTSVFVIEVSFLKSVHKQNSLGTRTHPITIAMFNNAIFQRIIDLFLNGLQLQWIYLIRVLHTQSSIHYLHIVTCYCILVVLRLSEKTSLTTASYHPSRLMVDDKIAFPDFSEVSNFLS